MTTPSITCGTPTLDVTPTAIRLKLRNNGYAPVPVAGKRPLMDQWQLRCKDADEPEIARWSRLSLACSNTGILCGRVSGVDIDVLDAALSERMVAKAIERLGPTPLQRIGQAPKTLLCYRLTTPIKKLSTRELFFADEAKDAKATKVEVLGDGQQFVAFGIHPDTHKDYHWPDQSPLDICVGDLPFVTAEALVAFVAEAEQMISKLTPHQKREAIKRREAGETHTDIARDLNVSHQTIGRLSAQSA